MKNLVSAATPFVAIMKILAFRFFCLTDLNAFFRALDYLIFREPGVVTDTHGSAMADRLRNSIQYEGGAGSENGGQYKRKKNSLWPTLCIAVREAHIQKASGCEGEEEHSGNNAARGNRELGDVTEVHKFSLRNRKARCLYCHCEREVSAELEGARYYVAFLHCLFCWIKVVPRVAQESPLNKGAFGAVL